MNIQFNYLYRDGANYKTYSSEIYSNKHELPLAYVDEIIRSNLIDEQWFYADKWMVKDLHSFPWDGEIDHQWHEYVDLEPTEEKETRGDICDFLASTAVNNNPPISQHL